MVRDLIDLALTVLGLVTNEPQLRPLFSVGHDRIHASCSVNTTARSWHAQGSDLVPSLPECYTRHTVGARLAALALAACAESMKAEQHNGLFVQGLQVKSRSRLV